MKTGYSDYCTFIDSKDLIKAEYEHYTCIVDLEKLKNLTIEDLVDIISININEYNWPICIRCSLPDGTEKNIEFKRFYDSYFYNNYANIFSALAINYQKAKRSEYFYLHADVQAYGQYLDSIFRTLPDEYKLLAEV